MQDQKFECFVAEIFDNKQYKIPIYQRNYAWEIEEIEQLLDDISSFDNENGKKYYLGTLVLNKGENEYEVVDGQQRLTTIYLILKALGYKIRKKALVFESRKKSTDTLKNISNTSYDSESFDKKIAEAMQFIVKYFKEHENNTCDFKQRLENGVCLFLINVPSGTDRNQYFEIMNTRGEQLEKHDILKGRIFEKLNAKEQELASMIWSACENMSSYVQLGFDTRARAKIFGLNYCGFKCCSFDDVLAKCDGIINDGCGNNLSTINEILATSSISTQDKENDESSRFKSIISFPTFLLVANRAMCIKNGDLLLPTLDDKQFLSAFEKYDFTNSQQAKEFLFELLRLRFYFDQYVIKTDYKRSEDGDWSLQMGKKQKSNNKNSLFTTPTFKDSNKNEQIKYLEALLRITYTSPRTMDWISLVLANTNLDTSTKSLLSLLEEYACKKICESEYKTCSGFGFERIVFTYLDYLLIRDGYESIIEKGCYDRFPVTFRNSIEHFHPQHPSYLTDNCEVWEAKDLNTFGNLALITVSDNSHFSNNPPESKINSTKIIERSPKLVIMSKLFSFGQLWTKELAHDHGSKMLSLIEKDLNKHL